MIENSYEEIINMEQDRQNNNIELIASENFCSERVRKACGSILTNKYAERIFREKILWWMSIY